MFDYRIHTFLTLCQTKNYTKTAEILHITQPAVTGHIKFLELKYNMKLFNYANKALSLTAQGEMFYRFAITMQADISKKLKHIKNVENYKNRINFGATLTIGEYTFPKLLCQFLDEYPGSDIHMHVDNTETLLRMLNEGTLDFAFIEGYFNKEEYIYRLFSKESFIPVCSIKSPLAYQTISLEELREFPLVIREPGSGSRAIIEEALHEQHLSLSLFPQLIELGNLNAIKELVKQNYGITFIYKEAVKHELALETLAPIFIQDFSLTRGFHFICLKNSIFADEYIKLFDFFKSARKNKKTSHLQNSK